MTDKIISKISGFVGVSYCASPEYVESELLRAESLGAPIQFDLNSPGGSVSDGVLIYYLLKEAKVPVSIRVIGEASSIASIFLCAVSDVSVSAVAIGLIHDPMSENGFANAKDLRATADVLDKLGGGMASIYTSKSSLKEEEWVAMMSADRVLVGQDFVDVGLASRVEQVTLKEKIAAWNMSSDGKIKMEDPEIEVEIESPEDSEEVVALKAKMAALEEELTMLRAQASAVEEENKDLQMNQLVAANLDRLTPQTEAFARSLGLAQAKELIKSLPKFSALASTQPTAEKIAGDKEKEYEAYIDQMVARSGGLIKKEFAMIHNRKNYFK